MEAVRQRNAVFGAGSRNPYEMLILGTLVGLALVLLAGALAGPRWSHWSGRPVRIGAGILAVAVPLLWEILSPAQSSIEGAARLLFIWPMAMLDVLLFLLWKRRSRASTPKARW